MSAARQQIRARGGAERRPERRPMPAPGKISPLARTTTVVGQVVGTPQGATRADTLGKGGPIPAIDYPPPPYFHGAISDMVANDRLWQAGMREGLFLVREVEENERYMLCVVRDDKVEQHSLDRDGSFRFHFVLNSNIRLWLACCVDEVIAEILSGPELRAALTGSPAQMLTAALGTDGRRRYLHGIQKLAD